MSRSRAALVVVWCVGLVAFGPCAVAQPKERAPGVRPEAAFTVVAPVYQGGLATGWNDWGWAPKKESKGAPAEVDFTDGGGWILARPGLEATFGGLTFRYRAPRAWGDFLEVRLESPRGGSLPRIVPEAGHTRDLADGWSEVWISFADLNPKGVPFDRIVLRSVRSETRAFLLDGMGFTREAPAFVRAPSPAELRAQAPRTGRMTIDCRAKGKAISPYIYGIAYDARQDAKGTQQWELGATIRRWGGNPTSRYNWKLGNAWNTANDWYFRNVNYTGDPTFSWTHFLDANAQKGVGSAVTVPMLGWVAKDTSSPSFPKSLHPEQQSFDPWHDEAGNGNARDGTPIPAGEPGRTSIEASPEFVGDWVKAIRARDAEKKARSVSMYFLDNEPMLWWETHRDVRPEPLGYDELLERTLKYGAKVRAADPEALIAGPAVWGWPAYFYSAVDAKAGFFLKPDHRAHGSVPLLAWYLRQLREYERKTGMRLLDVLDVHFYPQGKGVRGSGGGQMDEDTNARRIRATRALWDPTYVDESWIAEPIQLLPRLQKWIDENYPGTRIAIGEYSFGAEGHMSGGLAQAEALGRFAQAGVYAAFFWTYPDRGTPTYWAFRAYRNYDGQGARFGDVSLPAKAPEGSSLFASREGNKVVAVALNLDPRSPLLADLALEGCGEVETRRVFTFDGAPEGFSQRKPADPAKLELPPYSITVIELNLGGRP